MIVSEYFRIITLYIVQFDNNHWNFALYIKQFEHRKNEDQKILYYLKHISTILSSQSIKEQMGCNAFQKVKLLIVW